ncbi:MAG: type II/IV secretion system protein [Candidatus Colwellbacteria bacterium]|nr:type II/IV secretion system protein [Candidatus Colwellbacteria bacterium]
MDDRILANALVKNSLLTDELAQKLLTEGKGTGQSLEGMILTRRLVDETSLIRAKGEILGIPFKRIEPQSIPEDTLKLIPEETAKAYKFVPISRDQKMLVVGMLNPEEPRAQEALRFIAKQNRLSLGVYLVTPSDLELALRRYSPYENEIQSAIRSLDIKPGSNLSQVQRAVSLDEMAKGDEAPIIKIVSSTLRAAVEEGASDIHIEPQRSRLRIRFRVDGDLHEASSFPLELHQPIVSRVKILAELKIDETRVPQDGRFRTIIFGRDIDYRVSTFPTPVGEKVAIRVLDPTLGLKSIDNLGLIGRNADLVREAVRKPFGMVLITGPTGSGKTTTLYAFLQIINREEVNILSMEDPVEYFVEGVNQSQVRPEIGYTFASGLRQAVRQDPDVIMVGEIRDSETAELAVQAALTGQIVLSTLHTNNALGVIPRLIDMGVQSFLLPSSLNLMLAQRLVRRLCGDCRRAEPASGEVEDIIKKELGALSKEIMNGLTPPIEAAGPFQIYHAPGCKVCKGKGAVGRVGLFEVLRMTRELGEIVTSGPTDMKIREESRRQGMVSLRQDGILKALQGIVSMEEVLRETAAT